MKNLTSLAAAMALGCTFAIHAHADSDVPKTYPLKTCVVSDDPLNEHGKPVKATAPDGTVVYLCCRSCKKDFDKDPAKYAEKVKKAPAKK